MCNWSTLLNDLKLGGMKIVKLKLGITGPQSYSQTGNLLKKSSKRLRDHFPMIKSKKLLQKIIGSGTL